MINSDFEVRVDVSDGANTVTATQYVTYNGGGGASLSSTETASLIPDHYNLLAPSPNPVRTHSDLRFALPEEAHVQMEVFDVLGRHVATLVDQTLPAGVHSARFERGELASGVYVYRMTARGSKCP